MKAIAASSILVAGVHVARAEVPRLDPGLYEHGNLRVTVACASDGFVAPATGLRLVLDGEPLRPLRVNDVPAVAYDDNMGSYLVAAATDVGYLAAPGHHHLRIEAPDCEPDERDLDLSATYAERIEGRLAAQPQLREPAAAPDGFELVLGGASSEFPRSLASGTNNSGLYTTAYTTDPAAANGVWLSLGIVRRTWVMATDMTVDWGALAGTVETLPGGPSGLTVSPGPFPYTGSFFEIGDAFRFGGRLAWRSLALAAGSGIAGALVQRTSAHVDTGTTPSYQVFASPPNDMSVDWWLPVWASLSIKPGCNWGVEALASYDVRPSELDASELSLGLGLMWQPSSACSEPAGLTVSP